MPGPVQHQDPNSTQRMLTDFSGGPRVRKMNPAERMARQLTLHTPEHYASLEKSQARQQAAQEAKKERQDLRKSSEKAIEEKYHGPEGTIKTNKDAITALDEKYKDKKVALYEKAYNEEMENLPSKLQPPPGGFTTNKAFKKADAAVRERLDERLKDPSDPLAKANKANNLEYQKERAPLAQKYWEEHGKKAVDSIADLDPQRKALKAENKALQKENTGLTKENESLETQKSDLGAAQKAIAKLEPKPGAAAKPEDERQQLLIYQQTQEKQLQTLQKEKELQQKTDSTQSTDEIDKKIEKQENKCNDIKAQLDNPANKKFTAKDMQEDLAEQQKDIGVRQEINQNKIEANQELMKTNNEEIKSLQAEEVKLIERTKECEQKAGAFEDYQEKNFEGKKEGLASRAASAIGDAIKGGIKDYMRERLGPLGNFLADLWDKHDQDKKDKELDDGKIKKFLGNKTGEVREEALDDVSENGADKYKSDDLKAKNKAKEEADDKKDDKKTDDKDDKQTKGKKDDKDDKQTDKKSTDNSPSSNASDDNTPTASTPTSSPSPSPGGP
jgi:hypothetical protein